MWRPSADWRQPFLFQTRILQSTQSRINYRIDADLKERLRNYAESQGRAINEVLDEFVREHLDASEGSSETDRKRLERELEKVDRDLAKMEDPRNETYERLSGIGGILLKAYPELQADFMKIRLRAVSDFQRLGQVPWRPPYVPPKGDKVDEWDLVTACRFCKELLHLREVKRLLERKLSSIYGMEIDEASVVSTPAIVSSQEQELSEPQKPEPAHVREVKEPQSPERVSNDDEKEASWEEEDSDDEWEDDSNDENWNEG